MVSCRNSKVRPTNFQLHILRIHFDELASVFLEDKHEPKEPNGNRRELECVQKIPNGPNED